MIWQRLKTWVRSWRTGEPRVERCHRSEYEDVLIFHQHFQLLNFALPGHLSQRKLAERIQFMHEELQEFVEAASAQDLVKQADALLDLVYVVKGTACMLGLPWDHLWPIVHHANLAKVRGRGEGHRGFYIDVVKPVGWVPPEAQLAAVLHLWGYEPSAWVTDAQCRDDKGVDHESSTVAAS